MYKLLFQLIQLAQEGVDKFEISTDKGDEVFDTKDMVKMIGELPCGHSKIIVGEN